MEILSKLECHICGSNTDLRRVQLHVNPGENALDRQRILCIDCIRDHFAESEKLSESDDE